MRGGCGNRRRRSDRIAKAGAAAFATSALGKNCSCDRDDRAAGPGDGRTFSARLASDGARLSAGAAVLLGIERDHVCDRIYNDGVRCFDGRFSGCNADGKCLLRDCGSGLAEGLSVPVSQEL